MAARKTLKDCHEVAQRMGGRCLSPAYVGRAEPLLWKCGLESHPPFLQTYQMAALGHWCKKCSGYERITVARLREAAQEFDGELLSKKYVEAHAKLRWRCSQGHEFLSRWASVRQKHWCPRCAVVGKKARFERYTPSFVLKKLRDLHSAGDAVNSAALQDKGLGGLVRKAEEHYGSLDRALQAAGLDPSKIRKRLPSHDEASALAIVKKLQADGHPLHMSALMEVASGAAAFLHKLYGSHDELLRKLGLDPADVRRDAGTRIWVGKTYENICEQVFGVLRPQLDFQRRVAVGDRLLIPDAVDPATGEWWDFKTSGWGQSARASIKDYGPHARRLVLVCLTDRLPGSTTEVVYRSVFEFEVEAKTRHLKRLFGALRKLKATRAIDRSLEAWALRWTKGALSDFIRSLPPAKRNRGAVARRFSGAVKAAEKHGGWNALVEEVTGASPRKIHRRYEPADLVDLVKRRIAAGQRINPADLAEENDSLIQVVDRRMGGIRKVLAHHGIDYAELLKDQ